KYSDRTDQTVVPGESMRARCSPLQLHKTRELNLRTPCSPCENENRLKRSPRSQRQIARQLPDKSSKRASASSSQTCALRLLPVRADVDAATLPRPESRGKSTPE